MSKIAWTDKSIGGAALGLYGCSHAGEGCRNCWAESMASRFEAEHGYPSGVVEGGRWTGMVSCDPGKLRREFSKRIPGSRSKARRVFPWSTADLFHPLVTTEYVDEAFRLMGYSDLTFQILTKRLDYAAHYAVNRRWPPNVWLGASCSTQADVDRLVPDLLRVPAAVRFLSLEPLIDGVDLGAALCCPSCGYTRHDMEAQWDHYLCDGPGPGVSWVIVGAESGPRRRPCRTEWVRSVVEQCREAGTACFVKQLDIEGRVSHDPAEWPADLRVREFPEVGR